MVIAVRGHKFFLLYLWERFLFTLINHVEFHKLLPIVSIRVKLYIILLKVRIKLDIFLFQQKTTIQLFLFFFFDHISRNFYCKQPIVERTQCFSFVRLARCVFYSVLSPTLRQRFCFSIAVQVFQTCNTRYFLRWLSEEMNFIVLLGSKSRLMQFYGLWFSDSIVYYYYFFYYNLDFIYLQVFGKYNKVAE